MEQASVTLTEVDALIDAHGFCEVCETPVSKASPIYRNSRLCWICHHLREAVKREAPHFVEE